MVSSNSIIDGSKILVGIPKVNIQSEYFWALSLILLIFILILIFMFIASNKTTKMITKGLSEFVDYIRVNEDQLLNNSKFKIDTQEDDEVSILKAKFINVLNRMTDAYKSLMKAESQNSKLEINLLQARINPHLLYNSLTAIRFSALRNKDEATIAIVDSLSSYYRLALNNGEDVIAVGREIDLVREYINIINLSYMKDYKFNIDISEEILEKNILKHLLQPIVENSVLHGLNGIEREGMINIKGWMEGAYIIFQVKDNGFGMDKEIIDSILSLKFSSSRGGYGIKNLIKRIKLYYSEACSLNIESEVGVKTTVTLIINSDYQMQK